LILVVVPVDRVERSLLDAVGRVDADDDLRRLVGLATDREVLQDLLLEPRAFVEAFGANAEQIANI